MNDFIKTLIARRSIRAYQPEQVREEDLAQILEAGTYAACGKGAQSGKIVVVQDKPTLDLLERLNAAAMGKPDAKPFYRFSIDERLGPVTIYQLNDNNALLNPPSGSGTP